MKRATVLSSIVLVIANFHGTGEAAAKSGSAQRKGFFEKEPERLAIRVASGDWGSANPAEIEVLLNSVAHEILKHFPGRRPMPIVVTPSRQGPLVMYQKGPSNEYQILLAAKDDHWAEYVYEFSHELMHILAGYDQRPPTRLVRHQWFEEMLCEAASLYMLKHYALSWDALSPRPEWRGYAQDLERFTSRAMSEKHRRLPSNVTFQEWFRDNGPGLATKPYLREKNELVAMMFLPLLEQMPDWRAIEYLNAGNRDAVPNFYDYLARWYQQTPPSQQQLVLSAFRLFHFSLPARNPEPTPEQVHVARQLQASGDDGGAAGRPGR